MFDALHTFNFVLKKMWKEQKDWLIQELGKIFNTPSKKNKFPPSQSTELNISPRVLQKITIALYLFCWNSENIFQNNYQSGVLLSNHPPPLPKFLRKSKGGGWLGSRSKFPIEKKRFQQGKNPKKIFCFAKSKRGWLGSNTPDFG